MELTPEKFNQYLKEEGLDAVAALRARRNQTEAKAREIFSRCAAEGEATGPGARLYARARRRTQSLRDRDQRGRSVSLDL